MWRSSSRSTSSRTVNVYSFARGTRLCSAWHTGQPLRSVSCPWPSYCSPHTGSHARPGRKKFSGFFLRKLSPAARTLKQLRHHALAHHSPQFIDTAHQPVFYMRIQNGFDGHIEKIHHLLLIRSLFAKIICQLQKIISIVNPPAAGWPAPQNDAAR